MLFLGYGNTPDCQGCNKQEFMKKVLDDVIGESVKPVIVSPSMSGGWSLPFIKKYQGNIIFMGRISHLNLI